MLFDIMRKTELHSIVVPFFFNSLKMNYLLCYKLFIEVNVLEINL